MSHKNLKQMLVMEITHTCIVFILFFLLVSIGSLMTCKVYNYIPSHSQATDSEDTVSLTVDDIQMWQHQEDFVCVRESSSSRTVAEKHEAVGSLANTEDMLVWNASIVDWKENI